jgi:diguanylate cyclase (GGDEF)-like protein
VDPSPTPTSGPPETAEQARLRPVRAALGIGFTLLTVSVLLTLARNPTDALLTIQAVALAVVAGALLIEFAIGRRVAEERRARDAGLTRMLQRLSRSANSETIVAAIVEDLRRAAAVDHVVISRLRPSDGMVDTTLVSGSPERRQSNTTFSPDVLDPQNAKPEPGRSRGSLLRGRRPEQVVAEEISRRVRAVYGLSATLAAPLMADDRVVGAIVLSRRAGAEWTSADRRLLHWAAEELSVALARAYRMEAAETLANIDPLTGLPNRRYLEEMVAVVGPRRRAGDSIGVLMVDIDHFKRLNDRYGHTTGDRVLRAVGERISAAVRTSDTPARYGGEEFAVVLRRANREQALEVAERIRHMIGAVDPAGLGIADPISVSVGVAVSDTTEVDVQHLLQAADKALYRAKREGRNRVVLAG